MERNKPALASPKDSMQIMRTICREFHYGSLMSGFLAYQKAMERKPKQPVVRNEIPTDILSAWDREMLISGVLDGFQH